MHACSQSYTCGQCSQVCALWTVCAGVHGLDCDVGGLWYDAGVMMVLTGYGSWRDCGGMVIVPRIVEYCSACSCHTIQCVMFGNR